MNTKFSFEGKNAPLVPFQNLTPDDFCAFLRELQKDPYRWPNLYFAWEKPDGSLFMVGVKSSQMYQMIVREINPNSWINDTHASFGDPLEYSSVLCGISPNTSYIENNQQFDPIERLVSKVSEYSYLGAWEDPDILMYDPYAYTNVIACGRWELAVSHICPDKLPALKQDSAMTVDDLIDDAKSREVVDHNKNVQDKTLE